MKTPRSLLKDNPTKVSSSTANTRLHKRKLVGISGESSPEERNVASHVPHDRQLPEVKRYSPLNTTCSPRTLLTKILTIFHFQFVSHSALRRGFSAAKIMRAVNGKYRCAIGARNLRHAFRFF